MKQKHTFYKRKSTKQIAKVSPSNNNNSFSTTTTQGSCRLLTFCVGDFSLRLYAVNHGSRQRHGSRHAKAAATTQTVATTRASERRSGPLPSQHTTQRTDKFWKHPPPTSPARGTSASTTMTACRSSGARGRTGCLPCPGRRSESRGTSWSRMSVSCPSSSSSTFLCRSR